MSVVLHFRLVYWRMYVQKYICSLQVTTFETYIPYLRK